MNIYSYLHPDGTVIQLKAARLPSEITRRKAGTWVVREFNKETGKWEMPCSPEITLSVLKTFEYLGCRKVEKIQKPIVVAPPA